MKYISLEKLYRKDKEQYKIERARRENAYEAIRLPLDIFNHHSFFIPVMEISSDLEKISQKHDRLLESYHELPAVAKLQCAQDCLLDEIKFSNDIEGVHSSRREIFAAFEQIQNEKDPVQKKRFFGITDKYNKLMKNEDIPLSTPEDLRALYNDIVLQEMSPHNCPDGKLFRADTVELLAPSQKVKHRGIEGEENIISAVHKALSVRNMADVSIPIQTAILHYYLGYIHPFYDGNGRLARFISSFQLSKRYDPIVSYRLSYVIKNNRKAYYRAFDECNSPYNNGDLTPFIISFLEIIEKSVDSITKKVNEGIKNLNYYENILEKKLEISKQSSIEYELLYLFIQNQLFTNFRFDTSTLATLLGKSSNTVKRRIKKLSENGFPIDIEKIGKKYIYKLKLDRLIDMPPISE